MIGLNRKMEEDNNEEEGYEITQEALEDLNKDLNKIDLFIFENYKSMHEDFKKQLSFDKYYALNIDRIKISEEEKEDYNEEEYENNQEVEEEPLKDKTPEEIQKEIEEIIQKEGRENITKYEISDFIRNYLINKDILYNEIYNYPKLNSKIERLKLELENKYREKELKREKQKQEKIKKIQEDNDLIILELTDWAKNKEITYNIFSHDDIINFLIEKHYFTEEDKENIFGSDFRYIWLEVKKNLKKK